MFLLPIDWRRREFSLEPADFGRIDWGTLLLFGSGLALGDLMVRTGLVGAMAGSIFDWLDTPDVWTITAVAIAGGILLSEFTSNAAAATALIPVVLAICQQAGVDEMPPLMGVTFAASFGSALPVSTPPNAIVYGSGLLPARRMVAGRRRLRRGLRRGDLDRAPRGLFARLVAVSRGVGSRMCYGRQGRQRSSALQLALVVLDEAAHLVGKVE